jgi:hypothetical protein
LGSHNLALILIGVLAISVLGGGTLPQVSRLSSSELIAFRNEWQFFAPWADYLGLTAVFRSDWFFLLCIALIVNMAVGMAISIKRRISWLHGKANPRYRLRGTAPLTQAPSELFGPSNGYMPQAMSKIHGHLGLWGIPLFHLGISVIVLGGIWSSLGGFAAHLELSEGESYAGHPAKLMTERRGRGDLPDFGARLRLDRLQIEVSENKRLRELKGHVSIQQEDGQIRKTVVETNHPLTVGEYRLFPNNTVGYSAVFDRIGLEGERRRLYIHFPVRVSEWESPPPLERYTLVELQDAALYYDMTLTAGNTPVFDLAVHDADAEVFKGRMVPGDVADLKAYRLVFMGAVGWMGFYLASDKPMQLVFGGFLLSLLGFLLHLLVRFRRTNLVVTQEGWEASAWFSADDWGFEKRWQAWAAQVAVTE